MRVRGLKFERAEDVPELYVAPRAGAWSEILPHLIRCFILQGRPARVRGLKYPERRE